MTAALKAKRPQRPEDIPGFEIRVAGVDDVSRLDRSARACHGGCVSSMVQYCVQLPLWLSVAVAGDPRCAVVRHASQLKWMMEMTQREGWNKCPRDMFAIHTIDRDHSYVGTVDGHRVVSMSGHVYKGSTPLFGYMYVCCSGRSLALSRLPCRRWIATGMIVVSSRARHPLLPRLFAVAVPVVVAALPCERRLRCTGACSCACRSYGVSASRSSWAFTPCA